METKLPTQKEQYKKLEELITCNPHIWGKDEDKIIQIAKQYAKWYAEKVIDRVAEVATVNKYYANYNDKVNNIITEDTSVDKDSILNVKKEL